MSLGNINDQLVFDYRRDMRRRGLLQSTIDSRASRLRLLAKWLGRNLLTAERCDIEEFLDGRQGRGQPELGSRARYRWVSDIHCFFAWALREDMVTADPTAKIIRPKLHPLLPRPIGDGDLDMALQMADRRMRTMLLTAHLAGARCMEIALLERADVMETYVPPLLRLHGKGDKDRIVPLHDDLLAALRSLPLPPSGRVFRNAQGRTMTPGAVSQEINSFLHGLGIADTAHALRHWFGTRFLQQTGNLRAAQKVLGHASPTTTAGYTAWLVEDSVDGVQALRVPGERIGGRLGGRLGEAHGGDTVGSHDDLRAGGR